MTKYAYTFSRASQHPDNKATDEAEQALLAAINSAKPARVCQILKQICILHPPAKTVASDELFAESEARKAAAAKRKLSAMRPEQRLIACVVCAEKSDPLENPDDGWCYGRTGGYFVLNVLLIVVTHVRAT